MKLSSKSQFSYYEGRVIKSCSREKDRGIKNNPVIDERWIEGKGVKVHDRRRKVRGIMGGCATTRTKKSGKKERERESEWWAEREEVGDPHGNRIKTLGKRNFSCGKGCWRGWGRVRARGSADSARLEIRQRNPGTALGVVAISLAARHDDVPCFSIH